MAVMIARARAWLFEDDDGATVAAQARCEPCEWDGDKHDTEPEGILAAWTNACADRNRHNNTTHQEA